MNHLKSLFYQTLFTSFAHSSTTRKVEGEGLCPVSTAEAHITKYVDAFVGLPLFVKVSPFHIFFIAITTFNVYIPFFHESKMITSMASSFASCPIIAVTDSIAITIAFLTGIIKAIKICYKKWACRQVACCFHTYMAASKFLELCSSLSNSIWTTSHRVPHLSSTSKITFDVMAQF